MKTAKSIILQKASNYIKLWQNQLNPIELTCTLQRAKYRSVAREQTLASQGSQSQQPQWTSQETGVATPAAHEARSNCPAAISSGCGVLSSIYARNMHHGDIRHDQKLSWHHLKVLHNVAQCEKMRSASDSALHFSLLPTREAHQQPVTLADHVIPWAQWRAWRLDRTEGHKIPLYQWVWSLLSCKDFRRYGGSMPVCTFDMFLTH